MSSLALALAWMLTTAAEPTAQLDLDRYLGTWFEIARFDHRFERGCAGVTARYSKTPKGDIEVLNRCLKGGLSGKEKTVSGRAWVPDPADPGKLKVQFFWPFRSDYWVLDVAPDYTWALVGDSDKSSCWIMSRTPQISQELYNELVKKLQARGYDTSKLLRVEQPGA